MTYVNKVIFYFSLITVFVAKKKFGQLENYTVNQKIFWKKIEKYYMSLKQRKIIFYLKIVIFCFICNLFKAETIQKWKLAGHIKNIWFKN